MNMRAVVFIVCIVCTSNFFDVLQAKPAKLKQLIEREYHVQDHFPFPDILDYAYNVNDYKKSYLHMHVV